MQTLDVDASALTVLPEDGEWVFFGGYLEPCTNAAADLVIDANGMGKGGTLCMVWSEAGRSDLAATGHERVPVIFRHSFHCELELYNYDSAALPQGGDLLTVSTAFAVINGDTGNTRLVLNAIGSDDLGAGEHWVVGQVLKSVETAGDPMEVLIFDTPKAVTQL
jgi:hypothetical protein